MLSIQKMLTVCCLLSCSVLASALPTVSVTPSSPLAQAVLQHNHDKLFGSNCGPACVYIPSQGCVC